MQNDNFPSHSWIMMVDIWKPHRRSINQPTDPRCDDDLQEELRVFTEDVVYQNVLTDVWGIRVKTSRRRCPAKQSDATSRHQDSNMYEGRAGWVTAIPQSQTSQWGHFLWRPQVLVKLGTTRTTMAATATAATARFQPPVSLCWERDEDMWVELLPVTFKDKEKTTGRLKTKV